MWSVFLKGNRENIVKKVLTHPCIIAVYVGAVFMGTGIVLPEFLVRTISALSDCNTPISMMLVGMLLAELNPKGIIDRAMIFYAGVRLVIIPGIVFLLTMCLQIDSLLRGIAVIIAGMPAPITTALLSAKYEGDETYATGMIFVTTVLSLITLPIWSVVLEM